MHSRIIALFFLCPLLLFLVGFDVPIEGEGTQPEQALPHHEEVPAGDQGTGERTIDSGALEQPRTGNESALELLQPPVDPCLPSLYRDWQELSIDERERRPEEKFTAGRIIIERQAFHLTLEGIRTDGSVEEIYETHVALGNIDTPTPTGRFLINHIYCYPDVVFYDAEREKIPALYNGFFAPLLACNDRGACARFHELGIHGYDPAAYQQPVSFEEATYGGVSSGCIRIPNPCRFKTELISLVGIGPVRKNDRGCYHWLDKPVEVFIVDDEITVASFVRGGLLQIG
ncbi:MAG: L,D-transpeptidase, partial [Deltaproteobacteria bacterium]